MNEASKIIRGGRHVDFRGILDYVNEFDMSQVKRMYKITHSSIDVRRGWRGHQKEQRWFYVVKGVFEISLVKIDNFESPDPFLKVSCNILSDQRPEVLHVPTGYGSMFRALEMDSICMVFADTGINDVGLDEHIYPIDYFKNMKVG